VAKKPKLPGAEEFFATGQPEKAATPKRQRKQAADGAEEQAAATTGQPAEGLLRKTTEMEPSTAFTLAAKFDPAQLRAPKAKGPPRCIPQPPTEKITFYIPQQMVQHLEVCRVRLLTEHSLKANRSQIAQAALALTIYDVELIANALMQLGEIWGERPEE